MKKLATLLAVSALAVAPMAFAASGHTSGHGHHHAPATSKAPAKSTKSAAPSAPVSKTTAPTAQ